MAGTLVECGDAETPAWCLAETGGAAGDTGADPATEPATDPIPLDFGDGDQLAADALADFDGDGVLETNAAELAGLVGTEVTLVVTVVDPDDEDAVARVLAIADEDYLAAEGPDAPR